MSDLFVGVLVAILVTFLLVRARWWPLGPCWACRGRAGRSWGSSKKAYGRCHACGGSGRHIRLLARIYPKWRDEARKGKT